AFRNALHIALVALLARDPHAATFTAGRFRHQAQLVFSRNASRVHLDELAVTVVSALLIESRLRRSGADHRVGGLAEDRSNAAGGDDDRFRGEGDDFHAAQVHGANAATDALVVDHRGEELPAFVLGDLAFGLVAAHLLVERIQQLLPGSGTGKSRPVVQRSTKATEIEQTFRRAVEGDAHAVEQVNDARPHLAHRFHRRLVGEEVAAIDRVVEVLPGGVALALEVLGGIDATLGADRV